MLVVLTTEPSGENFSARGEKRGKGPRKVTVCTGQRVRKAVRAVGKRRSPR